MQIMNGFVHWDATRDVPDLDWAASHYSPEIHFVEAPDYVFEGWAFDEGKEGDERFIKPIPPDGWLYDDKTGGFYQEGSRPSEPVYKTLITETINLI